MIPKSIKKWIAILGIGLFLFGAVFGLYLLAAGLMALNAAVETSPVYGDVIRQGLDRCPVVLAEHESAIVRDILSNSTADAQNVSVDFAAPAFEITPSAPSVQVTVPPSSTVAVSWVVTPKNPGNQWILVSDGSYKSGKGVFKICGIAVIYLLGLTSEEAQFLSVVSIVGGVALIIPWLDDKWQQRKKGNR